MGKIPEPLLRWGVPGDPAKPVDMDAEASVLEGLDDVIVVSRGSELQFSDW